MGSEYSIADVATLGWVRNLIGFYGAGELVEYDKLERVPAWLERGLARPAVQRAEHRGLLAVGRQARGGQLADYFSRSFYATFRASPTYSLVPTAAGACHA